MAKSTVPPACHAQAAPDATPAPSPLNGLLRSGWSFLDRGWGKGGRGRTEGRAGELAFSWAERVAGGHVASTHSKKCLGARLNAPFLPADTKGGKIGYFPTFKMLPHPVPFDMRCRL